ncbi:sensor histidine kinase [Dorea sp. CAG:317]|nr:sensor histidine kinase [Dorea sp. CAG:317]
MKKLSVRLRITLLYTFFMTVLTAASLFLLFSLSSREVLTSAGAELEEEVHESVEELTIQNGEVRVDSDFYSLEKGVYLALYDEQGYFLYGRVPYGFDVQPEFEDGNLRKLNDRQKKWFVYDQFFKVDGENSVYVRGVTSITDVEEKFYVTMRIALLSLPLMLVVTVLAGFYFTGRTLLPVKQMTGAVKKIREEENLSGRIGLEGHGRKDEIYVLAETFDEMLAQVERLNLSELTEMAVEEQKLLAEKKGLCRTFELQIEPEVYARADESYYIRLLVNLLENAVYYGKENGMVKVTLSKNGKMIEGIVEDNGIGISEEDLVHIWERFYRADPARSTDSHSGLGLSMVKWIVEAHGGTIRAESRLGECTRFIFEIPE